MSESMRERMARAIYERDFPKRLRELPWSRQDDKYREMYRGFVDAILDVLAEPSEEIADRGEKIRWSRPAHVVDRSGARQIWAAMITAIRKGA